MPDDFARTLRDARREQFPPDDPEEAETCFNDVLDVSDAMHAQLLEWQTGERLIEGSALWAIFQITDGCYITHESDKHRSRWWMSTTHGEARVYCETSPNWDARLLPDAGATLIRKFHEHPTGWDAHRRDATI